MPTYEYQCRACGYQMDAFQKISDAPLTDCPKCKQPALTKLVSAAQFQLKGSGWYKTDYKAKPTSTAQSEGNKDKAADAKSSDTKDEKTTKGSSSQSSSAD